MTYALVHNFAWAGADDDLSVTPKFLFKVRHDPPSDIVDAEDRVGGDLDTEISSHL